MTLIGATTENPAFEVNGALLSRAARVRAAARSAPRRSSRCCAARRRGRRRDGRRRARSSFLAARSEGDARTALNALELAARDGGRAAASSDVDAGSAPRTRCSAARCSTTKPGDRHYDYASAWIKATRGSDPDASLYYLAVMLEGGEDPRFIVRRMVILASEDIGNADPRRSSVATAAAAAVEHVGLPEARYALAQAAIYLSLAPKSDAAGRALGGRAGARARARRRSRCPPWLRSGPAARAGPRRL